MFDISIHTALQGTKNVHLIKPENRFSEIEEFLFYVDKIGFYLSEEQKYIITEWSSYVNCECESYSWYEKVKKLITYKWGEDFFTDILFNHGYLLQRTERRNQLILDKLNGIKPQYK